MAKKPKTNGSYSKITKLLLGIPEFRDVFLLASERMENVCIESIKYDVDYYDRPISVVTIKCGVEDRAVNVDISVDKDRDFYVRLNLISQILTDDLVKEFVKNNFGVAKGKKMPVPTFNCKLQSVIEFFLKALRDQGENLPPEMSTERGICIDLHNQKSRTEEVITSKIQELVRSQEYADGCQQARADFMVEKIRSTISKFKDVTPEILKRALDTYIMHEIMEG